MELKRRSKQSLGRPDLGPMIDVVFHLLIFFMTFSAMYHATMTASLNIELPQAVSNSEARNETFEINVTKDGVFYVTDKMVTGTELVRELEQAALNNPNLFVIVNGDKNAVFDHIVEAMDYVNQAGLDSLGLGVLIP